jgi:hypothetical protein
MPISKKKEAVLVGVIKRLFSSLVVPDPSVVQGRGSPYKTKQDGADDGADHMRACARTPSKQRSLEQEVAQDSEKQCCESGIADSRIDGCFFAFHVVL